MRRPKTVIVPGMRFGRLTVVRKGQPRGVGNSRQNAWICLCDCGEEKEVVTRHMTSGDIRSCGCLKRENDTRNKYGSKKVDDMREWSIWKGMKDRCQNPNLRVFRYYGGRGIKVCDRWLDFNAFMEDMGEAPPGYSLDRIDCNGDYCPENCRWANSREQANNRRSNRRIAFEGREQTVTEWARDLGVPPYVLLARLNVLKWTEEKTLTTPYKGYSGRTKVIYPSDALLASCPQSVLELDS